MAEHQETAATVAAIERTATAPEPDRIVAVTAGGPYPWVVINAIGERFGPVTVLVEEPESRAAFLKRRARRVGWVSTAGQFATMALSRYGKRFARDRERDLIREHDLRTGPDPQHRLIRVASANAPEAIRALQESRPAVVFLAGCRMLSKATLAAIDAPVINYHAGINPRYRGMNGGYWALATGDRDNYGTTVHLVDAGVDTGGILYQQRIEPDGRDTLLTHAMVLAAHSRGICVQAVEDALADRLRPVEVGLDSRQWYHPPIWSYLWTGVTRGVW